MWALSPAAPDNGPLRQRRACDDKHQALCAFSEMSGGRNIEGHVGMPTVSRFGCDR